MDESMKLCPFCVAEIPQVAKKCKFCGEWIEQENKLITVNNPESGDSNTNKSGNGNLKILFIISTTATAIVLSLVYINPIVGTQTRTVTHIFGPDTTETVSVYLYDYVKGPLMFFPVIGTIVSILSGVLFVNSKSKSKFK